MISRRAAGLVAKRGYTNVRVFTEGIPGWVKAGYSLGAEKALPDIEISSLGARQLKELLDDVVVLDIRPRPIYQKARIRGSINIPLTLLSRRYTEVPRGRKVVAVDLNEKRVLMAARFLRSKGYDALMLRGGVMGWAMQGLPLEK